MDYVMSAELQDFDMYDIEELELLTQDLQDLSYNCQHLNSIQYVTARNKYAEVISYISTRLVNNLRLQIEAAKLELDSVITLPKGNQPDLSATTNS
jgi:hypothetical protein